MSEVQSKATGIWHRFRCLGAALFRGRGAVSHAGPAEGAGDTGDTSQDVIHRLSTQQRQLEQKIAERTRDLSAARDELQARINDLRQAEVIGRLGSWSVDLETWNIHWSDGMYHLVGQDPGKFRLTRKALEALVHPEDIRELELAVQHAMEGGGSRVEVDHRVVFPDGRQMDFQQTAEILRDESGQPVRMIGMTLDITQRRRYENELRQARQNADEANLQKTSFIGHISHELRTPVTSMMGFAELLKAPETTPEKVKQYADTILRNSSHLLGLINDLLDTSMVDTGQLVLADQLYSPRGELNHCIELARGLNEGRPFRISLNVDPGVPAFIGGDARRFRQVLINVLGNAVKFSSGGSVDVAVGVCGEGTAERLQIRVHDSAPPIDPQLADRIFKPFGKSGSGPVLQARGAGLGLALARRLARAMGGDVVFDVASSGPRGNVFLITVATHLSRLPEKWEGLSGAGIKGGVMGTEPARESIVPNLGGVKILVVEDNPDIQEIMRTVLAKAGAAAVAIADDGHQCLETIRREKFDVVVMDMHMPGMDGLTTFGLLRESGFRQPVIAVTAYALAYEAKCMQAGFSGFLPKPVDTSQLVRRIAKLAGVTAGE